MIVAIGKIETGKIIEDLIKIAKGENELHEKNTKIGEFKHHDGWGMAYYTDKMWHTYKSTKPIYKEDIDLFKEIRPNAIILHTRRATKGEINIKNTQPFNYQNYVFAHNGTIFDEFKVPEKYIEGNSDSAKWFNSILSHSEKSHEIQTMDFNNYTSANFIFAKNNKIIIGQRFKKNPKYSTMKMYKDGDTTIISSEILPGLKDKQWVYFENDTILELDII